MPQERLIDLTAVVASHLRQSLRNLRAQAVYASIGVIGLAVGMTCAILVYLYVDHETSWDTFRPNADRVYRILRQGPTPYGEIHKPFEGLSGVVGPALVQSFPEIEQSSACA